MGKHPNQVRHMVNKLPNYIGYSDRYGIGMGVVWKSGLNKIGHIIWKEEWTQKVKEIFKTGTLNINDI